MSTASNTIKNNKINNTKNTKNINDLKKQVEKLTEESKKQREFILYLYSVIFGKNTRPNGKTKLNESLLYHNNTTFGSLIDEVQALSTAMAEIVYNNPQNYYNNKRGPRSGYSPENPGYMNKIKKRGELKKSTENKNGNSISVTGSPQKYNF